MKRWVLLVSFIAESVVFTAHATPPLLDTPSTSGVESLVKTYVDEDFILDELPPPEKCTQYSKNLMFAYDWNVIINKIGDYDSASKLLPVEATVIVRCGPFQSQPPSQPPSLTETDRSAFPLRSETPIDFKMTRDPDNAQQWKVHEVILWKRKQKVIEK
jgi:hypothetical protein